MQTQVSMDANIVDTNIVDTNVEQPLRKTLPLSRELAARRAQQEALTRMLEAPDMIPDDIFYMNFDCTNVSPNKQISPIFKFFQRGKEKLA